MKPLTQKLLNTSLVRFLIGATAVAAATFLVQILLAWLGDRLGVKQSPWWMFFVYAGSIPTALGAYVWYVHIVERRAVDELALRGAALQGGSGVILGIALFGISVGTVAIFGLVTVSAGAGVAAVQSLGISMSAAVSEELLFRGLLFRLAERSLGSWPALAISATLFGVLHLLNPGAGLVSTLAIAAEAGLLLCAAYMLTRKLWLAMGLHFGWNATESALFGAALSGNRDPGLFATQVHGPDLISGGAFGMETSVVAIAWSLVASTLLLVLAYRRGQVRPLRFGAAQLNSLDPAD